MILNVLQLPHLTGFPWDMGVPLPHIPCTLKALNSPPPPPTKKQSLPTLKNKAPFVNAFGMDFLQLTVICNQQWEKL